MANPHRNPGGRPRKHAGQTGHYCPHSPTKSRSQNGFIDYGVTYTSGINGVFRKEEQTSVRHAKKRRLRPDKLADEWASWVPATTSVDDTTMSPELNHAPGMEVIPEEEQEEVEEVMENGKRKRYTSSVGKSITHLFIDELFCRMIQCYSGVHGTLCVF